jgi:soluble lytic murein transglycosylase
MAYLAYDVSFYGLLASEEAGISELPKSDPVVPDAFGVVGPRQPAFCAADAQVLQLDLRPEALREWIWTIKSFDDRQRLIAAQYALSKGLFDRAINTADTTGAPP